jgi:uncharacterized protein YfcZ (UPF0381/DUF406 family)
MNRKLIAAAIAAAMLGGPVFAETDPVAEIEKRWAERAEVQQKMAQHMEMMKSTMSKLQASDDPQVRKQLMDEHMQEMRQMMGMMNAMPVSMNSGHAMGGAMHGADQEAIAPMCKEDTTQCKQINAMAKRHMYIEREISMMQMMMQQMMEHGAAREDTGSHEHE